MIMIAAKIETRMSDDFDFRNLLKKLKRSTDPPGLF